MIVLIFLISFIAWLLASYRTIALARTHLFKAGLLSFIEEIFSIGTVGLIIINHLNIWYLISAGLGAFCGVICDVEGIIKWVKQKLTNYEKYKNRKNIG